MQSQVLAVNDVKSAQEALSGGIRALHDYATIWSEMSLNEKQGSERKS